jgi:predicted transcriptional regulator
MNQQMDFITLIKRFLAQCGGNKSEVARRLKVSRTMVHRYIDGDSKPTCDRMLHLQTLIKQ